LLGHWSGAGLGAAVGMGTPAAFRRVAAMPGCNCGTLRYAMGATTHLGGTISHISIDAHPYS